MRQTHYVKIKVHDYGYAKISCQRNNQFSIWLNTSKKKIHAVIHAEIKRLKRKKIVENEGFVQKLRKKSGALP